MSKFRCNRDCFIQNQLWKRDVVYELPEDMKNCEHFTPVDAPAPDVSEKPLEPQQPDEGQGFGNYLCPKCKVTHRAGSKVHKRHLKLLKG